MNIFKILVLTSVLAISGPISAKKLQNLQSIRDAAGIVIVAEETSLEFFCKTSKKDALISLAIRIAAADAHLDCSNEGHQVSAKTRHDIKKALRIIKNLRCEN